MLFGTGTWLDILYSVLIGHNLTLSHSLYLFSLSLNRYHHGHYIIWQGLSFPDGMTVIEGPEPGFMTDLQVWAGCTIRHQINQIMLARVANGQLRLKCYGDKVTQLTRSSSISAHHISQLITNIPPQHTHTHTSLP